MLMLVYIIYEYHADIHVNAQSFGNYLCYSTKLYNTVYGYLNQKDRSYSYYKQFVLVCLLACIFLFRPLFGAYSRKKEKETLAFLESRS